MHSGVHKKPAVLSQHLVADYLSKGAVLSAVAWLTDVGMRTDQNGISNWGRLGFHQQFLGTNLLDGALWLCGIALSSPSLVTDGKCGCWVIQDQQT